MITRRNLHFLVASIIATLKRRGHAQVASDVPGLITQDPERPGLLSISPAPGQGPPVRPLTAAEWEQLYREEKRLAWDWQLKANQFRSEVGQLSYRLEMLESAAKHSDAIARKQDDYIRQLEEKLRAAGIALPPNPLAPPPGVKALTRIRTCTYDE